MTTRVAVDANVLISALLAPGASSPPSTLVRQAMQGEFTLVLAELTLIEVLQKTEIKPFLQKRLSKDLVDRFMALLRESATVIPASDTPSVHRTRDPKDDYLLAPEIVSLVDHIVTGDRDLLEYTGVEPGFILSAAAFLSRYDFGST